jgi:hypothetical protein
MKYQLDGETLEQARTTLDFMAMAALAPLMEGSMRERGHTGNSEGLAKTAYSIGKAMMAERAKVDALARSETPTVDESYAAGTRVCSIPAIGRPIGAVRKTADVEQARAWEFTGYKVRPE